jgi:hypothetical protein
MLGLRCFIAAGCLPLIAGLLTAARADITVTSISVPHNQGAVLRHYGRVVSREVQQRFRVNLPVISTCGPGSLCLQVAPSTSGWKLEPRAGALHVEGATAIQAVHGLGEALRSLDLSAGKLVFRAAPRAVTPTVELRGIYTATHFGNAYERWPVNELGRLYEDWALWGANANWSFVDSTWRVDPFSTHPGASESLAHLRKVFSSLLAAQRAGLEIGLAMCPNNVWLDQFQDHPELRARMGARLVFGSLLCPSLPGGRGIILSNTRNALGEAQRVGLRIRSLDFYNRDYGGCLCDRCRPWHRTSLSLFRDNVRAGREFYPDLVGDLITWYWTAEETRDGGAWLSSQQFSDWLRFWFHHFPTWDRGIHFPRVDLPSSAKLGGMYNLSAADNDVYGAEGAITRLAYLGRLLPPFARHGLRGFHGYTEGNYDDLNKVVTVQLLVDPKRPIRSIVTDYCRWHFGAKPALANELAGLILKLDEMHSIAPQLSAIVQRLLAIEKTLPAWGRDWRFAQIRLRAQIAQLNMEVLDGLPPRGAEAAGGPRTRGFKDVIGPRVRELARRGLQRTSVLDVQNAAWDAYRYLMEKDSLVRKRAVLMHELMRVYGVDADQTVGLTNIYLGDWPTWWGEQHSRYHTLIQATTVAEQHKLIEKLWP